MAALCHFYPGYTLEAIRDLTIRDFNGLAGFCEEVTSGG